MVKIYVGCAGWAYKDWIGPFYPKKLEKYRHLEYYANFFEFTEINTTFYNVPAEETVYKWATRVPDSFRYVVKVNRNITHNLNAPELDSTITQFFYQLEPLKKKVIAYLMQFPPWFRYSEKHLRQLNRLIKVIPSEYKYIIELRDNSWFERERILKLIDGSHIIQGTTYLDGITPYYLPNQNIYYIRLIGDRQLTVFNLVQRAQREAIKDLYQNIQKLIKAPEIYEIFIILNNHFTGFAPETANEIKKKFSLPYLHFNWTRQKKLIEFL